jgi:hypothetical protein
MSIFALYTYLNQNAAILTINSPSYSNYQYLLAKYPDTVTCSCSQITQSYSTFITFTPSFHQVCASIFVNSTWLYKLRVTKNVQVVSLDWRIASAAYFQTLSILCESAQVTVWDALRRFGEQDFVSTRLLNEALLVAEANVTIQELLHSTQTEFSRVYNILRLLNQVDQYFTGTMNNGLPYVTNETSDGHLEVC